MDSFHGNPDTDPQRASAKRAEFSLNGQSNDFTTLDKNVASTVIPANNKLRVETPVDGADSFSRVYPPPATDPDNRKVATSNLTQPPRPFLLRGSSVPQSTSASLGPRYSSRRASSSGHFLGDVPSRMGSTRNPDSTQNVESARFRVDSRGRRISSRATGQVSRGTPRHTDAYGRYVIVAAGSDSDDLFDCPNYPTARSAQELNTVHNADIVVSDSNSDNAAARENRPTVYLGVIDVSDSEVQDRETTISACEIRPTIHLGYFEISDSDSDDRGADEQSAKTLPDPAALMLCSSSVCHENDDGASQDVPGMDSEDQT
ncbi:hypothetical protein GALMADRAFT_225788 [Galerina marginata CBS 339.88]|uniref:Uncharacterized protein n=1 Tax=Galerina marginata (strain CBS 339.88) TaxID=685588 RepID=A0A067TAS3_GALM3|nr:hypothetical protein GALMADRAFT_225788 [Galerina marginata CBS 339.88]